MLQAFRIFTSGLLHDLQPLHGLVISDETNRQLTTYRQPRETSIPPREAIKFLPCLLLAGLARQIGRAGTARAHPYVRAEERGARGMQSELSDQSDLPPAVDASHETNERAADAQVPPEIINVHDRLGEMAEMIRQMLGPAVVLDQHLDAPFARVRLRPGQFEQI